MGIVPILLLAYLHVRYTARMYPLLLVIICLGFPYLKPRWPRVMKAYLVLVLLFQSWQMASLLPAGHWVPD